MAPTGKGLLGSNGFSPALQPRFTFGGSNGVAILESACKEVGVPATIRVDQSSEVVSRYFELGLG